MLILNLSETNKMGLHTFSACGKKTWTVAYLRWSWKAEWHTPNTIVSIIAYNLAYQIFRWLGATTTLNASSDCCYLKASERAW